MNEHEILAFPHHRVMCIDDLCNNRHILAWSGIYYCRGRQCAQARASPLILSLQHRTHFKSFYHCLCTHRHIPPSLTHTYTHKPLLSIAFALPLSFLTIYPLPLLLISLCLPYPLLVNSIPFLPPPFYFHHLHLPSLPFFLLWSTFTFLPLQHAIYNKAKQILSKCIRPQPPSSWALSHQML